MLHQAPRALRLHWDAEAGWLLDVPWAMPQAMVRGAVDWALPKQIQRYNGLPAGDKRDELKTAIEALRRYEVRQNVVGARGDGKGDLELFQARRSN